MNFEEGMRRLAEITETLEKGTLSLEESVALYGEGAELTALCRKALDEAKLKVAQYGQDADGTA